MKPNTEMVFAMNMNDDMIPGQRLRDGVRNIIIIIAILQTRVGKESTVIYRCGRLGKGGTVV